MKSEEKAAKADMRQNRDKSKTGVVSKQEEAKKKEEETLKRFSAEGKFIQVVAVVPGASGECVRVTVATSSDGSRYYMLDTTKGAIRVFAAKG